jgi:uncharacterized DUF497 family protein
MEFTYDQDKDKLLRSTRGIGFQEAVEAIESGDVLADSPHPKQTKYADQRIMVLQIAGYAYVVPYLMDEEVFVLKTVYPNRKFKHLIKGASDE